MSENDNTEVTTSEETETQETAQETEEFDWKAAARKWETRAKEHKAALDASQAEAARVAELETQLNALTEEAGTKEAASKEAFEKATLELTRLKAANKYGISSDEADLFLTGTNEEDINRQAEALAKRSGQSVKPDLSQGNRNGAGPKSAKEDFNAFHEALNRN